MKITIIADASWCPATHAGGYGYWIASQRGKLPGEGEFQKPVESSMLAEMMALVNALHGAIKNNIADSFDTILFQTDCQSAIDLFLIGKSSNELKQRVLDKFKSLVMHLFLTVEFKHVKGHTSGGTARLNCNIKCDRSAKFNMRKMRERIMKEDQL